MTYYTVLQNHETLLSILTLKYMAKLSLWARTAGRPSSISPLKEEKEQYINK